MLFEVVLVLCCQGVALANAIITGPFQGVPMASPEGLSSPGTTSSLGRSAMLRYMQIIFNIHTLMAWQEVASPEPINIEHGTLGMLTASAI